MKTKTTETNAKININMMISTKNTGGILTGMPVFLSAAAFALALIALLCAPAFAQSVTDIENDIMIYDYRSAAEKCRKIMASKPDLEAGLLLSKALHLSGDTAGAAANYSELISKFPGEPSIYAAAARYAAEQIKFDAAKKIYADAAEKFTKDPAAYQARKAAADSLFASAFAYYDKMKLRSEEIELYKATALNLYAAAPNYFSRAVAYFTDNKMHEAAFAVIKEAETREGRETPLLTDAKISVYENMIAAGADKDKNIGQLDAIYEKYLLAKDIGEDKRNFTCTAYFNFLKNNRLLDNKIEKLKSGFAASADPQGDLLLINLLMQGSGNEAARDYIAKFVAKNKDFASFISAARVYRHYGEHLRAMKMSLAAMACASGDADREALCYEMASNLSKFYFIDLRYLIFKNAAVELFEERCDDLAVNLLMISSSRRFMRSSYDAIRVALRQYLSRTAAVQYYIELIDGFKNSASRDRYLNELAVLYGEIGMDEQAYLAYDRLCSEMTGSVYFSGALKNIVKYQQRILPADSAAARASAAVDARADLSTAGGVAAARSALELLVSPEDGGLTEDKNAAYAYYKTVYDYLSKKRNAAADKKWIDSKMLSMLSKLYPDFGRRLEIIDGMLKNSPYDITLLNAKESCIVSGMTYLNSTILKKALQNFYDQNYFVSNDLLNKYLQFLNKESKIEAKIEELKKAAAAGSLAPHKLKLLAGCCFFISDFEQAEKWYDEFVKHAPADSDSLMKLANLKRSFKKNGEAVALLDRLIAVEPSNKNAYVTAGDIIALDKTRKWDEADRFFGKITAIDPENNDNYIELATIYWDYYRYDEGLAVLAERRRAAASEFIFGREIASLFELNGSIEVAIPEYISVICAPDEQAAQKHYAADGEDEGDMSANGGFEHRRYEHYNYRYERPETADVIECRARLNTLYKKENFKKLIDAGFEKFIEQSPLNYKLYYEYSKLLIEFGLGGRAFEVIKKSYPSVVSGYQFVQLANLLERVKKTAEAKNLYYKAIEKDPGLHSSYSDALEFFTRFAMNADYAKTLKARAEKFQEDPYYLQEYSKYMMDYKGAPDNENYREAAAALEKLIAANPRSVTYRNLLSDAKIKLEGMKSAIAYIEGLIKASEAETDKNKKFHIDDIVRLKETLARLLVKERRVDEALAIRRELIYDNPAESGFAATLADIATACDCEKKVSDFIASLDEKKVKPANRLFLSARYYERLNMFDAAAGCYKKLTALNPNDAAAVTDYFALCSKARRFDEAKKLTARYMQLAEAAGGETERQAYEDCASLYIQSGDSKEALVIFDRYLEKLLKNFKPDENSYVYYSYQYAAEINWLVKLLESHSYYAEAISYLEKKLLHLNFNVRQNGYLIDETSEKISALYEKNGDTAKALELIAAIVQSDADSGSLGSVSESMLKRLVDLWKKTSNYARNIKQYAAMIEGAESNAALDEKQLEVLRFLLRIYRLEPNPRAFIALAKKYEPAGSNLNSAVDMAAASPEFERDLIDLLLKRIRLAAKSNSTAASTVDDMIRLGVIMAKNNNNSLAEDFFGMALKYGRYNDNLKKIAESLLDKNIKTLACKYYNSFLNKCSERSYYLNAPEIALAMVSKECYREAAALASKLMQKHGDDIKIMLDCASVYRSVGDDRSAAEIYKKAALGAVKVEQVQQAVNELDSLLEKEEYIKLVDEMTAAKHKNGFAPDYAFLYNIKASRLFSDALAGEPAGFEDVDRSFMAAAPSADVFIQYLNSVLEASSLPLVDGGGTASAADVRTKAAAAYMKYCLQFAEKMSAMEDLASGDASQALSLMVSRAPAALSFKDFIAPLAAKLRPKTGVLSTYFIYETAFAQVSFESRETELLAFYKENYPVETSGLLMIARQFTDARDFKTAAAFAGAAANLDPDDQTARLAQLETLCGEGNYARAETLAGAIDAAKLKPKRRADEYNDDGNYSYEHALNTLRFAGCLYELKRFDQAMSACSLVTARCRRYFEYEDAYLFNDEYKRALELYFKSAVTPESRAKVKNELFNCIDEFITFVPRYGGGSFENKKTVRALAEILCSWSADVKLDEFFGARSGGPAPAYLKILYLAKTGARIGPAAAAAVAEFKSNFFVAELLVSLADDIDDKALLEKIFSALAAADKNNAAKYREAYLRRYCSDSLNVNVN